MRRLLLRIAAGVAVVAAAVGVFAWWLLGRVSVERVTNDVYLMTGVGGNVAALVTGAGVVLVDSMTFWRQGDAIQRALRTITDQPVVAILNTHYHRDHTHGNPAFPPGTRVIATDRTLAYLQAEDAAYWQDPRAHALLPNETVQWSKDLHIGAKTIRAIHPGRAHTGGDLVVLFAEDRVVCSGDLFFNGLWPNIDLEAGGSVRHWSDSIQRVIELPYDKVIPGHGPVSDRDGWRQFQLFMATLWAQTSDVAEHGGSVEDALRTVDVDRYGLAGLWFVPKLSRDFVIRRAYEDATHADAPEDAPPG